jgi:hypothetical protein
MSATGTRTGTLKGLAWIKIERGLPYCDYKEKFPLPAAGVSFVPKSEKNHLVRDESRLTEYYVAVQIAWGKDE